MLDTINDYIEAKLTHSIHTSERRSFRGCRRRWNWIFREYYYPKITAKPLEFGVAFHKAMEAYYDPANWHDHEAATALAIMVFKRTCEEQYDTYLDLNDISIVDPEVREDYEERIQLGIGMLKHYLRKVAPMHDRNFTPVKVEIKFEVPITNPDTEEQLWCKCDICWKRYTSWVMMHYPEYDNPYWRDQALPRSKWKGLPITYGGRLDMLAQDEFGMYWVYDWKTARALTSAGDDDFMLLDDQITSYCWAMWVLGLPVVGFVYAEIKKTYPQEPEPLKKAFRGRLFSTNKQNSYDYDLYKRTVAELDPEAYQAGLYDDFLEYLAGEENAFARRHQIHRSPEELKNAGRMIYLEALDMTDSNLRIYTNAGRFSCGGCAFQQPCLGQNRNEDYQYTLNTMFDKRRYHYYEDKEPSTESKGAE
jgi:hypothetical protein